MLDRIKEEHRAAHLTQDELEQGLLNIGFDLSCGRCASLFYTGHEEVAEHDPTCRTTAHGHHKTRRFQGRHLRESASHARQGIVRTWVALEVRVGESDSWMDMLRELLCELATGG